MSDEDIRRGVRNLINEGAQSISDRDLERLEEVISETKLKRGLSSDKERIKYLEDYINLAEELIEDGNMYDANWRLAELNERFPNLKGKKKRLIAENALEERWSASAYC